MSSKIWQFNVKLAINGKPTAADIRDLENSIRYAVNYAREIDGLSGDESEIVVEGVEQVSSLGPVIVPTVYAPPVIVTRDPAVAAAGNLSQSALLAAAKEGQELGTSDED